MNQLADFNWVDIVISVVIILSLLFGLWRGLVKEVLSLVTWVAALIVARVYSQDFAPLLESTFEGETTRMVTAFVLLFFATLIVGAMINHLMAKLISFAGLQLTDRLLGGAFGFARGGLIVMLGIFVAGNFFSETLDWQESRLIPYGQRAIEWSRMFVDDISQSDQLIETSSPARVLQ
ncbi:MAG: CvpA family protein [Gammaproteobacteria bacterium]|nr:CvpA family protein [Pseudomonadales bacterium]MCP5346066.1 CvpA family protein [Pseudomonadales bacterium]